MKINPTVIAIPQKKRDRNKVLFSFWKALTIYPDIYSIPGIFFFSSHPCDKHNW